ncbi:hypothetical protein [Candidatus Frankia nodulisporulans]|uniref:hypothetical protein n=1 Tax=Candidatus Frankia nodulisporulans TaxID=2060052 RepID=UPI0013D2A72C|nr:hypothetical protein [Candidatus Frankia nodulisporulans]
MSQAPSDPDPEDSPNAESTSHGSAEPPAPPSTDRPPLPPVDWNATPAEREPLPPVNWNAAPGERPPLRPVDWDGSFTRTWASRDDQELTNRLSARYDLESAQRELAELMRKQTDEANAQADARAQEARERAAEQARAEADPRQRLFDRMGKLGRVFDEEDNGNGADPGDSSGQS